MLPCKTTSKQGDLMKITTKDITYNAIICALYITLTLLASPIAFLGIQFRIAEILVLLCFFNPSYTIGLVLGTAIANFNSPMAPTDIGLGALATLLACLGIIFMKHLLFAVMFPIVTNSLIVGFELYWLAKEPLLISIVQIALSELIIMIIGYILFYFLHKRKDFKTIVNAKRNENFKF